MATAVAALTPRRHWRERKVAMSIAGLLLLALLLISINVLIFNPKGH